MLRFDNAQIRVHRGMSLSRRAWGRRNPSLGDRRSLRTPSSLYWLPRARSRTRCRSPVAVAGPEAWLLPSGSRWAWARSGARKASGTRSLLWARDVWAIVDDVGQPNGVAGAADGRRFDDQGVWRVHRVDRVGGHDEV